MLSDRINYIVSGLERSGTSAMMQVLEAGGAPVAYDGSRPADYHNPKGYYELEGGKIIRRLMERSFPIERYRGRFIKVTAYGLKFLPEGRYKIIYMLRDLDEILDSQEKMAGKLDRESYKPLLEKLNQYSISLMESRGDMEYILVSYHDLLSNPEETIDRVNTFIGNSLDPDRAKTAIDTSLYRNRRIGKMDTERIEDHLARMAYLGETRKRSWVKSIGWRLLGIVILGGISWLLTHSWQETTAITVAFHAIRFVLYYFYERAWDRVRWGRIPFRG